MAVTYEPIATQTLGSGAASVSFSSIPATYTDLILVIEGTSANDSNGQIQFNGDTSSNYSMTMLYGNGSAAGSTRTTSATNFLGFMDGTGAGGRGNGITHIMNYSNTAIYKTSLSRHQATSIMTRAVAGLWRSTAAINAIRIYTDNSNFETGSTFTLYGIKAA